MEASVATLVTVMAEEACLHRDWPRKRPARWEVSPGRWMMKCGDVIAAHLFRGDCTLCRGSGFDPNGCCGDLCPTCGGSGEQPVQ